MIKGYMQGDLRNPIVHKYMKYALKRWECVSDVFQVNVVQCVKPHEDLNHPLEYKTVQLEWKSLDRKNRSPQEIASLLSQYRYMKQIAEGEKLWIMEHDAYLRSNGEAEFRRVMGKFNQLLVCNIGIAMECYTCQPQVAKIFCDLVENDSVHPYRGPMTILHMACDAYSKQIDNKSRNVWWPKQGQKNETGLSYNVTSAFRNPKLTVDAPVTQIMDKRFGSTVTDRPTIDPNYHEKTHPNFEFVTLDLN